MLSLFFRHGIPVLCAAVCSTIVRRGKARCDGMAVSDPLVVFCNFAGSSLGNLSKVCWASIELWVETSGCDSQFTGGQWPVASDVLQSFACECDSGPSSADKRGFPSPWQLVAASSMAPPSSLRPGPGPAVAGPAKPNSSCLSESSRHHFEPRPPPRLSHPDLDPGSSCPISPDQKPRVSPTNPAARRAAQHRPSAPRASTSSPPPPTSCRKT